MKACELRVLLNQIPDDVELKFEFDGMIYLDYCQIVKYPDEYLRGSNPFYYLKPCTERPEKEVLK